MYFSPLLTPNKNIDAKDTKKVQLDDTSEITLHERRLVFENTIYKVYSDHISDKNDHEVKDYLSVEPKVILDGDVSGVSVLPVNEDKVGLIQIFRHPLGRWTWEAIKGHVDIGENVSSAASRELNEEAGFSLNPKCFSSLGVVAPEAGVIKGRIHLFKVNIQGVEKNPVEGEIGLGEMVFHTREEVFELIAQGRIEDATTICILLKDYIVSV